MERPPKKQKLNYEDEQQAHGDDDVSEELPECFMLNADCWYEIFECLSLPDIHSVGETCTHLQSIAGLYYKSNFKDVIVYAKYGDIYTDRYKISGFCQYVENIGICHNIKNFRCIQKCHSELKKILFNGVKFDADRIESIKPKLNKVEKLEFNSISFERNLNVYEDILRHCPELKHLEFNFYPKITNEWLLHKYPKLEHNSIRHWTHRINKLHTFFIQNLTIKSIKTNSVFLKTNWKMFKESNLKLDEFRIHISYNEKYAKFKKYLTELHSKSFYKRLFFNKYRI